MVHPQYKATCTPKCCVSLSCTDVHFRYNLQYCTLGHRILPILFENPESWPICDRPVALRGHVTNASFKRCVGILLMPKIDRAHKNYLTPEIWEGMHLREIFYGTLIFQQSSMICIGCDVGGHTLFSNMAAKTTFCLYLVKRLIVTLRCAVNVTTLSFQHFP